MRKVKFVNILAVVSLSLAVVVPAFATGFGIDLKVLTDDDLTTLYTEVVSEMSDRGIGTVSDIYPGVYTAGVDITPGNYLFKANTDNMLLVNVEVYEDGLSYSYRQYYGKPDFKMNVNPGDIVSLNLKRDQVVLIENGSGTLVKNMQAWIPEETENPVIRSEPTDAAVENSSPIPSSGIRPEVKEAIDSYEAFMTKYFDFMANYDSSDLTALGTYLQMLEEVSTWGDKMDVLDDDMNEDESSYYLAATSRILQKELEAMGSIGN